MRFCGLCGTELVLRLSKSGQERKRCPACSWTYYETPTPVVLVLPSTPDGQVVYTRKNSWPEGVWALVSGFIDGGESAESAALREVLEETGLKGELATYLGSVQARGNLLLCFHVQVPAHAPVAESDVDQVRVGKPEPELIPEGVPARWLLERWMSQ